MWQIDTSGLGVLVALGVFGLMGLWIRRSVRKGRAVSEESGKPYDLAADWPSVKRLGICGLLVFLWFAVMPFNQVLDDDAAKSTLRTEFGTVTEEDRVRVEDTLTREHREARLEDLRIQNQDIQDEKESDYEEFKSQGETTDKGEDKS